MESISQNFAVTEVRGGILLIVALMIVLVFVPHGIAADLVFSGKVLEYVDDGTLRPVEGWRVDLYDSLASTMGTHKGIIDTTVTDKDGHYALVLPAASIPQTGSGEAVRIEIVLYNSGYTARSIETVSGRPGGVGSNTGATITYTMPLGGKTYSDNNFILEKAGGAAPSGTVLVSVGSIQGSSGTAQIPISIKGAQDLGNMDLQLDYSGCSNLLYDSADKGSLTQNALIAFNDVSKKLNIGIVDIKGINGDGSLAYVTYTILSPGTCNLVLSNVQGNKLDGSAAKFTTSNGKVISGELKGDLNKDGFITSVDALMALQMSTGELSPDLNGDLTGDGKISSLDAIEILKTAGSMMARGG